jgi:hypothetical protein
LFRDASYFEHLIPLAQPVSIQMADQGSTFLAYEHGPVSFFILNSTSGRLIKVRLSDALHVPTLQKHALINFLDLGNGGAIEYLPDSFKLALPDRPVLWIWRQPDDPLLSLLIRPVSLQPPPLVFSAAASAARDTTLEARRALARARAGYPGGHIERLLLRSADNTDYLPVAVLPSRSAGDLLGKMTRAAFPSKRSQVSEHGTWVALDTSGPHPLAPDVFNGGRMVRYMLVLVDLGSKFVWVYFMARKSDASTVLRAHFDKHGAPRFVKSDNALELTGAAMDKLKADFGFVQWTTCDYTSEQNPAERAIRTIHEKSSTFAAHTNIDPDFGWPILAWMSANSMNALPQLQSPGHKSAFEARFGQQWNFSLDRIPGARAFVHDRGTNKFALHAYAGLYLGRADCSMLRRGYVVLLVETGQLVISPSVYVQENVFPPFDSSCYCSRDADAPAPAGSRVPLATQLDGPPIFAPLLDSAGDKQNFPLGVSDSISPVTAKDYDGVLVQPLLEPFSDIEDDDFVPLPEHYVTAESTDRVLRTARERRPVDRLLNPVSNAAVVGPVDPQPRVPTTVKEALQGPDSVRWQAAIDAEFANLRDMGVYVEIDRADSDEIILNSVWVFKIKPNGLFRARLAACGYGAGRMPLSEVFAPVVSTKSLLVLLALSSIYRAKLASFDVVSAFMHGKMDGRRNRYAMRLPAGYTRVDSSARFLRLLGSINGLKEASQIWSDLLCAHLRSLGFAPTAADPCLYIKHYPDSRFIILSVHVDDGLSTYTATDDEFDEFCSALSTLLDGRIKWGTADEYLAMDIIQSADRSTITLSMESYLRSVLATLPGHASLRTYGTPLATNILRLLRLDKSAVLSAADKQEYMRLVGILNYVRKARPDIEYATSIVASCVSAPTAFHLECVRRIFGYLKGSISLGRTFTGEATLIGLSDSDFGNTEDGYNYSGNLIMLGGSAIVSGTKKQSVVTTATADAELLSLSSLVRSVDEVLVLLDNLRVSLTYPVPVLCDNKATVLTATTQSSRKSRHLAIAAAHVRDHAIRQRSIAVNFVGTRDNLADFFTKPLPMATFIRFRRHIMLGEPFRPTLAPPTMTRK